MPALAAHRKPNLALVIALASASAGAATGCHRATTPPSGDVAASLAIKTLAGDPFDPAALRGKPAVVTFWRPGCPYCASALPKDLAAARAGGATAVAVMISGSPSAGAAEMKRLGWDGPTLIDDGTLSRRYAVPHVPYTFVLRPDGTASRVFDGDEASQDDVAAALAAAR